MTTRTAAGKQLNDYLTAAARTLVPFLAGQLITIVLRHTGVDLHGYSTPISAGIGFAYFAGVHWLERYIDPAYGWLLGIARNPAYQAIPPTARPRGSVHHLTVQVHADTEPIRAHLADLGRQLAAIGAPPAKPRRRSPAPRGH